MSEADEHQPKHFKPAFENKYKRTLSLNDSWNLGKA